MVKTIGNPVSWLTQNIGSTGEHIGDSVTRIGGTDTHEMPTVQTLTMGDLRAALRDGYRDFLDTRADAVFVALIYPVAGLVLFGFGLRLDLVPLLAPLVLGFALLGPVAAVGLYEISRWREQGQSANWFDAFGVFRSPSFGAILVLGLYLTFLFLLWLAAANGIYNATLGPEPPASIASFARDTLTTPAGWTMIAAGSAVGAAAAVLALAISVVSFPLLLDRKVGVPVAVVTSIRVLRHNPREILSWGAIVIALLVLGAIPLLLGLVVVMPVLGHATWHLYRRAVV